MRASLRDGAVGSYTNSPDTQPHFPLRSAPCVSYSLRKRALQNDMRQYLCCQGHMPCSGCFHEQSCPELCLGLEVTCCFANSVVSTRYLLQDSMIIQNTECDNCLIGFLVCMEQLACIFQCIGDITGSPAMEEAGALLTFAADATYCSVCACMQTQHKVQMDARDNGTYVAPAFMAPPDVQTMGYGATGPQSGMYR